MGEQNKHKGGKRHNLNRASHNKERHLYERQRVRTTKNTMKSWDKHLEKHPNDKQSADQIKQLRKEMAK